MPYQNFRSFVYFSLSPQLKKVIADGLSKATAEAGQITNICLSGGQSDCLPCLAFPCLALPCLVLLIKSSYRVYFCCLFPLPPSFIHLPLPSLSFFLSIPSIFLTPYTLSLFLLSYITIISLLLSLSYHLHRSHSDTSHPDNYKSNLPNSQHAQRKVRDKWSPVYRCRLTRKIPRTIGES